MYRRAMQRGVIPVMSTLFVYFSFVMLFFVCFFSCLCFRWIVMGDVCTEKCQSKEVIYLAKIFVCFDVKNVM